VSATLAIVAAMEQEVTRLVQDWQSSEVEHSGRRYRVYSREGVVLVCGGIGPVAAGRAARMMVERYDPMTLMSTGFAGGLTPAMRTGAPFIPAEVVVPSLKKYQCAVGKGRLVSVPEVMSDKTGLGEVYAADAVDMEAAAVAAVAEEHHLPLLVVKAISDDSRHVLPPLQRFVEQDGSFNKGRFAGYALLRPWWWASLVRLSRGGAAASRTLAIWLEKTMQQGGLLGSPPAA
jgi:adenosylhomocysteine nucleosidase